jgi:hypothetical protein
MDRRLPPLFLRLQHRLDDTTDGFGAGRQIVLAGGPRIERGHKLIGKAKRARWVRAGRRPTSTGALPADLFWCCGFHIVCLGNADVAQTGGRGSDARLEDAFILARVRHWRESGCRVRIL